MTNAPAIIGWSHTRFGRLEADRESLMVEAASSAVEHAGLTYADIDVIHVGTYNNGFDAQGFEGALLSAHIPQLADVPAHRHENACATGSAAVFAAHDSVAAGRYRTALVLGVEKMTAVSGAQVNDILLSASYRAEEECYGSFAGVFAEVARLYKETYGDPSEAMARIAPRTTRTDPAIRWPTCRRTSASSSAMRSARRTLRLPARCAAPTARSSPMARQHTSSPRPRSPLAPHAPLPGAAWATPMTHFRSQVAIRWHSAAPLQRWSRR